ncbi:hypothetical protein Tco_1244105, partial [Tanacetum coccineum]
EATYQDQCLIMVVSRLRRSMMMQVLNASWLPQITPSVAEPQEGIGLPLYLGANYYGQLVPFDFGYNYGPMGDVSRSSSFKERYRSLLVAIEELSVFVGDLRREIDRLVMGITFCNVKRLTVSLVKTGTCGLISVRWSLRSLVFVGSSGVVTAEMLGVP